MKARKFPLSPVAAATFLVLVIWTGSAVGATEKVLHNFSAYAQGSDPAANLIADAAGNLYGTTFRGGAYEQGAVYKLVPSAHGHWTETFVYSFKGGSDGQNPSSRLVFDSAGNLYGTTSAGGTGNCPTVGCGTVFKLAPSAHSGWTESVLYSFQGGSDGQSPKAGLTLDSAGNLYGTTIGGGTGNCGITIPGCGTVFKLAPDSHGGWTESIVYTFMGGNDGGEPLGELIFDSTGSLYGTAAAGGASTGSGTVFKLTPSSNSWTLSVLHSFAGTSGNDGSSPASGLIFDKAGNLYGTTFAGGSKYFCAAGCGTAFELISNGDGTYTESVLHDFTGTNGDGQFPEAGLVLDQAGNLYGTTIGGGPTRPLDGLVFQLVPGSGGKWTENILHVFKGRFDGAHPSAGGALVIDQANNLYGTTGDGGTSDAGTVFELTPTSSGQWTKKTIYLFPGSDGRFPDGNLVEDASGNFYGTTSQGGASANGEVFKLAPNSSGGWTSSAIYSFQGTPSSYAPGPSHLVFDKSGNLYGTDQSFDSPYGMIFELKPNGSGNWTESTVYTFSSTNDGFDPLGLVIDSNGNLYGTTKQGGTVGGGTIFELTNNGSGVWTKTVLYNFSQTGTGGTQPLAGLIFDSAGNLYGTTALGGTSGNGVVFELSPSSGGHWTESVLYNFAGGNDGAGPVASLVFDQAGNLYGTTYKGGTAGHGTVFTLVPSSTGWTESVLHSFAGGSDGAGSLDLMPGLAIDAAGNLYGTTPKGGDATCNCGVVFELSPSSGGQWTETVLHAFTGGPTDGEGGNPLIIDPAGVLYGTSEIGGTAGDGTFFNVTP